MKKKLKHVTFSYYESSDKRPSDILYECQITTRRPVKFQEREFFRSLEQIHLTKPEAKSLYKFLGKVLEVKK